MNKTSKKILGILGLVIVIAMTAFAYFLPEPTASDVISVANIAKQAN